MEATGEPVRTVYNVPVHFRTNNRILAHALAAVGFRLLCVENRYDDASLERMGFSSVQAAHDAGKPGALWYCFDESADLRRALKAFDETQDQLKKGSFQIDIQQEDAIRVACAVLKTAPEFRDIWKKQPGLYFHQHGGESKRTTNPDGSTTVTSPGFILASAKLSEEQAKQIGL